jgi:hypothetical protein
MLNIELLTENFWFMEKVVLLAGFFAVGLFAGLNGQDIRVAFYNVENLCDTKDDPLTKDEEFLPEGTKNWTNERFRRKIVHIYQVMVAMGEGEMPGIIGFCEIENREVLNRLIYDTPLKQENYSIIHRESPDARGMDVALLYKPGLFEPDSSCWLKVPLSGNETTREILRVEGRMWGDIPVYIFVNHWPSRFSGAASSGPKRLAAASILAASIKEVLQSNPGANIIVMGDFNDEPRDESLQAIGKILGNGQNGNTFRLVNLSVKTTFTDIEGTIKHQGTWSVFDQLLVSEPIFNGASGCIMLSGKAEVFRGDFLLEPDLTYTGQKPFRTYSGPSWRDGFSDHLPVSIRIGKKEVMP